MQNLNAESIHQSVDLVTPNSGFIELEENEYVDEGIEVRVCVNPE